MTEKPSARTVIVPVRFTEAECVLLDGGAAGSTRSNYIRWRTLDPASPPPPRKRGKAPAKDDRALSELIGKLGSSRIASNLNQLAKAANSGSLALDPELEAELRQALADVAAMRRMLIEALGLDGGGALRGVQ